MTISSSHMLILLGGSVMGFIYSSPKREVHSLQLVKLSAEADKVSMIIESFRLEVTSGGLVQQAVQSRSQNMLLRDLSSRVLDTPKMGISQPFWVIYCSI